VGKQPIVGRSTGSPTLKEDARETTQKLSKANFFVFFVLSEIPYLKSVLV
jgi:hypothetical protein